MNILIIISCFFIIVLLVVDSIRQERTLKRELKKIKQKIDNIAKETQEFLDEIAKIKEK
jgi:uncharacterized membrane-anchored protein YhcB (DUF1043 family)